MANGLDLQETFSLLGIALGLGALVGLQRQVVESRLAGLRTFPLVTLFGALCGLMAQDWGGWIVAAGLLAVGTMLVVGNLLGGKREEKDPGLTTEIALLLMFAIGAYLVTGFKEVAVALGGGIAVLLHFKRELHGLVARLGEKDLKAIMQLALLSLVILPVLPNRTFGPFDVLNPRQIWLMIVLIVGISLTGYIAYKFLGERAGIVLGGILGGLISSTATTVSYAKRAGACAQEVRSVTLVIMIASALVFVRVLVEVALVAPGFLAHAAPPLGCLLGLFVAIALSLSYRARADGNELPPQGNPSELKSAFFFGLAYALVLLAAAAAKEYLGGRGLALVAAISGLTDMDAITLSVAQMVKGGQLAPTEGWRLIVLASLSNLVFKAGIVAFVGNRQLLKRVWLLYGIALVFGVGLLTFWPRPGSPVDSPVAGAEP